MSTFTLQDLTPTANQMGEVLPNPQETKTVLDEVRALGQTIADNTRLEAQAGLLDAPEPQPSLEQILKTIGEQFALLSTVINQGNSPNTTPPEGNQSLQETVSLTLQQAEWFKELVDFT